MIRIMPYRSRDPNSDDLNERYKGFVTLPKHLLPSGEAQNQEAGRSAALERLESGEGDELRPSFWSQTLLPESTFAEKLIDYLPARMDPQSPLPVFSRKRGSGEENSPAPFPIRKAYPHPYEGPGNDHPFTISDPDFPSGPRYMRAMQSSSQSDTDKPLPGTGLRRNLASLHGAPMRSKSQQVASISSSARSPQHGPSSRGARAVPQRTGQPHANGVESGEAGDRPYLSSAHNQIRRDATQYPATRGTREWSNWDGIAHRKDTAYLKQFKDQWVHGYRDAINAAAKQFDIPPELLGAVAHIEVGGAPPIADDFGYSAREEVGRNLPIPDFIPDWIRRGVNAPKDQTSFGPLSVQVRRAASSLGYGTDQNLTESQRRMVISSLEDPRSGIFVAAKHLSDLRDKAFGKRRADAIRNSEMQLLGAMYNEGPDATPASKSYQRYGKAVLVRLDDIQKLLK